MKSLWLLLAFVAVVSVAQAGFIDTDGYYVMDSVELSGFNGSVSGPVTLNFDGLNGTISGISGAANSYWIPFSPANFSLVPANLTGALGWKLTFTNTSTAAIQFELVVATSANGWQQNVPIWVEPGQTGTVRSKSPIQGPESMTNYIIVLSVPPAGPDVLTFTVGGTQDKSIPWNPNPVDDPAGIFPTVLPQVVLTWNTAMVADPTQRPNPNIRKHYILGNFAHPADPNMVYVGEVNTGDPVGAAAQYPATGTLTLLPLTVYKWQIVEGLDNGSGGVLPYTDPNNIVGKVWTFKTASYEPVITKQPVYTAVFPAQTATMTAEFFSLNAITANKWFWSGDNGATFTQLTNGVHPSGSGSTVAITRNEASSPKTSTLTITGAARGDDGWYYCALTNAAGTGQSANAGLAVKRQVAYYGFEGNLNDSSAEGKNGTAKSTDPNFAADISYGAGVSGQAVLLNQNSPLSFPRHSYIELPATGYPKPSPGGAMEAGTIMFWYKSVSWGSIIGSTSNIFGVNLNTNFSLYVNGVSNVPNNPSLSAYLPDDTWYFGAIRWQLGGENRLYAGHFDQNGISSAVTTAPPVTTFNNLQHPMTIGARTDVYGALEYFTLNAMIDDLKIYNYPLTDAQIAAAYNAVSSHGLCTSAYMNQYDFNGDCVVSLADFADFASAWLSCGVVPAAACGN